MSNSKLFYQQDLAEVHHEDFGQLATAGADFILSQFSESGSKFIVDLGCGTGITASALAKAGHQVLGVDYSPSMVSMAQKLVPEAQFVTASLFDFQIPPCDAVSIIGEGICYLFDDKSDTTALEKLFFHIYEQLKPGSFLVFDYLYVNVVTTGAMAQRFIEQKDWSMYVTLHKDMSTMTLTRDMVLFKKVGDLYQRSTETHRQRLYRSNVLENVLEQIGFEVTTLQAYGNEVFRPGHKGFFCQKP